MPLVGLFGGFAGFGMTAAGGDFESIATVTVGAGGASSIEFTSIPGTYQHLQVRAILRNDQSTAGERQSLLVQANSDTASNYTYHALIGNGSSATAGALASQTSMFPGYVSKATAGASEFAANIIDILDYVSTSKNTTVRSLSGHDGNGDGQVALFSGLWMSTAAVTSLKLTTSGNFVQYSTAALYGIKA